MPRQNDVYNNESSQRKAALKQKLDGIRNGDSAERVNTGVTLWNFIWNPKVPFIKKIIPIAALVYLVCPIDILPDVVPILGYADDLVILLLGAMNLYSNYKAFKGKK